MEDVASLLWVPNLGKIELHPFAWTVDHPREPTNIVFDLDPGPQPTSPIARLSR